MPQTALRLHPRRRAICAALCPWTQSFLSSATSFASQLMGDIVRQLPSTFLVFVRLAYDSRVVVIVLLSLIVLVVLFIVIGIPGRHRAAVDHKATPIHPA